jgi:hypothetical protein
MIYWAARASATCAVIVIACTVVIICPLAIGRAKAVWVVAVEEPVKVVVCGIRALAGLGALGGARLATEQQ